MARFEGQHIVAGVEAGQDPTSSNTAMKNETTILPFRRSETLVDPLTEIAREDARRMLVGVLNTEADAFVASFAYEPLEDGRQRIVRHGFGPERKIQTGHPGCSAAQGARSDGHT